MFDGKKHTQKEVADKIGISQSYISCLEKKIINRPWKEIEKNKVRWWNKKKKKMLTFENICFKI